MVVKSGIAVISVSLYICHYIVRAQARSFHDEVRSEGRVPFGGYTPSE
jgi:hypothetical protein